jgi:hypothetical protein
MAEGGGLGEGHPVVIGTLRAVELLT